MNKPGYKTTEFWLAVINSILVLVNQSELLGAFKLPIEAIMTLAAVVVAYIFSRAMVKGKEAIASMATE